MPQGSLALYRRHLGSCPHVAKGNRWTRCHCPFWVQGSIGGESIRRSLNTTNWTAASSVVHQWQAAGQIGVLKPEIPTVAEAVAKFLDEAAVRNLAATPIQKRRELLVGKLLPFCERRGFGNGPRQNVIRGSFIRAGQVDWAALCSRGLTSAILIFRNGNPGAIVQLARRPAADFL